MNLMLILFCLVDSPNPTRPNRVCAGLFVLNLNRDLHAFVRIPNHPIIHMVLTMKLTSKFTDVNTYNSHIKTLAFNMKFTSKFALGFTFDIDFPELN